MATWGDVWGSGWGGPAALLGAADLMAEASAFLVTAADPDPKVVLDYKTREELVVSGTLAVYSETALYWHHPTINFTAFKIRFGGVSSDDGFFIPTSGGSFNTEDLDVNILPNEIVKSVIHINDLLINDLDDDGPRTLRIYVKDTVTGEFQSLAEGGLEVPIVVYRLPPKLSAKDFILDVDSQINLFADREFTVTPVEEPLPGGKTEAALLAVNPEELITTEEPVYDSHIDGFLEDPTSTLYDFGPSIQFTEPITGTITALVEDAWGQEEIQVLNFSVTVENPFEDIRCDAGVRYSIPPTTRTKDAMLVDQYLPPWDALACQFWSIADSVQTLLDIETAPLVVLQYMFQEMGLTYPGDIPGYPEASLRRLLLNADQVHSTRFSAAGLRFYLGLLIPNVVVEFSGLASGTFIFLGSSTLGFPTVAEINTSGSQSDSNRYLFGDLSLGVFTITITGDVSDEMQEFVLATIRQEIPYADDPTDPLEIQIDFVVP